MPRVLRILILLAMLMLAVAMTLGERFWVRSWSRPLQVAIYPIALDPESRAYVQRLRVEDFQEIEAFLLDQSWRWRRQGIQRPRIELKPALAEAPRVEHPGSMWEAIQTSLGLRWYAFSNTPFWRGLGTVRLFLLYHTPEPGASLPHSMGMEKGLLGVVHVFSEERQRAQNNVVITHELLHALGARDKYDANNQPIHPQGYADPYEVPLLPQHRAEIMAGRIPLSQVRAEIPPGLARAVIGYASAAEIGW